MSKSKFIDDPQAIHFQMQFLDKDGGGSYRYFSAMPGEDIGHKAELQANEYLAGVQQRAFCGYSNPIKTVAVVQYDRNTKAPIKGGIKFKVRLSHTRISDRSGTYVVPSYLSDDVPERKEKSKP